VKVAVWISVHWVERDRACVANLTARAAKLDGRA